jgi:hypothetical protein
VHEDRADADGAGREVRVVGGKIARHFGFAMQRETVRLTRIANKYSLTAEGNLSEVISAKIIPGSEFDG